MDAVPHCARVTIFGEEYAIRGDVDAETTRQVADYVNEKFNEIGQKTASREKVKIAVLSALNIAGELHESRAKNGEQGKQFAAIEERIRTLTDRIDQVL